MQRSAGVSGQLAPGPPGRGDPRPRDAAGARAPPRPGSRHRQPRGPRTPATALRHRRWRPRRRRAPDVRPALRRSPARLRHPRLDPDPPRRDRRDHLRAGGRVPDLARGDDADRRLHRRLDLVRDRQRLRRRRSRAMACGAVVSLLLAVGNVTRRGDPIVIGVAVNLFAVGVTGFLLPQLFDVRGVVPRRRDRRARAVRDPAPLGPARRR